MKNKFMMMSIMAIALVGCVSSGNNAISSLNAAQIAAMIDDGKTSKSEIRAQFGDPSNIDINLDGSEKWSYKHIKSAANLMNFIPFAGAFKSGTNNTSKELVVLFDQNDIVKKHAFSASSGETNIGLFA